MEFFLIMFFFVVFLFCLWVLIYITCLTLYIIWNLFCCTAWSENVWFGSVTNWLLFKALSNNSSVLGIYCLLNLSPHTCIYIFYMTTAGSLKTTFPRVPCQLVLVSANGRQSPGINRYEKCESYFLLMVTVSTWMQTPRLLITTFPL